jgi:hypothetical protein
LQQSCDPSLTLCNLSKLKLLALRELALNLGGLVFGFSLRLIDSFDVSFALLVKVKHILIQERLVAEGAIESGFFIGLLFADDSGYELLPAKERFLLPLLVEHLVCRLLHC